ncbi:MAG: hypothetical protein JWO60_625 [Frankiales bacterium]|nr:hypothetical protein [Frankiales bacterium]
MRRLTALPLAALALSAALPGLLPTAASAATSAGCEGGGFSVTQLTGRTTSGSTTTRSSLASTPADARLLVRGRYVEFAFAPVSGNIYDYVYTGAANATSMTSARTPVWESKTLSLGPVLRGEVEVRTDGTDLTVLSRGSAGKVKVQAKDCATGGIFQQEVETAAPVTATHTLAANMYYFTNPYTNKINFGDGTDVRGKDSPQAATKTSQSERVTTWSIASGGRMGQVLGEDAVELSAGATVCVQDCQAQNRLRGSVPVTDPAFSG